MLSVVCLSVHLILDCSGGSESVLAHMNKFDFKIFMYICRFFFLKSSCDF